MESSSDDEPETWCNTNASKKRQSLSPIIKSEIGTQTENMGNDHTHCNELFGKLVASEMNHIHGQARFDLMSEILCLIQKKQIRKK